MARDKQQNKKKKSKETTNERPRSGLFNEIDARAAEVSYDTVTHGYPLANPLTQERLMPLGVVEIDESVKLPRPSPKSDPQNHDSKPHISPLSNEKQHTERVYLPALPPRHYPYEYYHPSSDYYRFGHLSYPYQGYCERHHHHHHHHHRHHHRHHKHKKEIETYDPRWWYMPINSVHGPKLERPLEQHYVAPKWYESPNKPSRILTHTHETKLSAQKYFDCRCEVCKPSKQPPRGARWIVNE